MRRILLASAAVAFAGAGSALAGGSASIEINADNPQNCVVVASSATITLGAFDTGVPGTFQYQCNFVGQPTLTFTSANGGVVTAENGGGSATYGIYLNDAAPGGPPSTWLQSNTTPQSYPNITTSTPANTVISPVFQVGLTGALPVAGHYSDTLTIDIVP